MTTLDDVLLRVSSNCSMMNTECPSLTLFKNYSRISRSKLRTKASCDTSQHVHHLVVVLYHLLKQKRKCALVYKWYIYFLEEKVSFNNITFCIGSCFILYLNHTTMGSRLMHKGCSAVKVKRIICEGSLVHFFLDFINRHDGNNTKTRSVYICNHKHLPANVKHWPWCTTSAFG